MTVSGGSTGMSYAPSILVLVVCATIPSVHSADFAAEVRPILIRHCYRCHGPDAKQRKAGLRLDSPLAFVSAGPNRKRPIVSKSLAQSELWRRLTTADKDERMPPPETGHKLSKAEKRIVRLWLEGGANVRRHYAYEPIVRPSVPKLQLHGNPIDAFVLARRKQVQPTLSTNPPATREQVIRRLFQDLTGLPPSLADVQAFVNDTRSNAYERLVERVLSSPAFGEKMALHWLDLARYADTHGYHLDSHREMWRWRDWVIDAFNRNVPYDEFSTHQLAGDLLPNPTLEQLIATGFNRNHMVNYENGAIDEEFRTEYVIDRVTTTSTVWLGQTLLCARCHDHKYDSITQGDFYRFFAFFNNIDEKGIDGKKGNAKPFIPAPTRLQRMQLTAYDTRIADLEKRLARYEVSGFSEHLRWAAEIRKSGKRPTPPSDFDVYLPLDETADESAPDRSSNKRTTRVENGIWSDGRFAQALIGTGQSFVGVERSTSLALMPDSPFTVAFWLFPTTSTDMPLLGSIASKESGVWAQLSGDCVEVTIRSKTKAIATRAAANITNGSWQHIVVVHDPSQGVPVRIYINGKKTQTEKTTPIDFQFVADNELKSILVGGSSDGAFRGLMDEVVVFSRKLPAKEVGALFESKPIDRVIASDPGKLTSRQERELRNYYLENVDKDYPRLVTKRDVVKQEREKLRATFPTTMVMAELPKPRKTHVLIGGNYQRLGDVVSPDTPKLLGRLDPSLPRNRLGLARWLFDRKNPLTARVAVNRFWQQIFGRGIVATPDDFGVRGALPTHPDLLDWLAAEFIESKWDMKHMIRLMVCSTTYRQSCVATDRALKLDPNNVWLARSTRRQLPGEMIRDQALSFSGLFVSRIGGASVQPYQPKGLWREVSDNSNEYTAQIYRQRKGADLYRRSMYTFWKRAVPPPNLEILGSPSREVCTVVRSKANSPSQALVIMNDPVFIEAARHLATKLLRAEHNDIDRIHRLFNTVLARRANAKETAILVQLLKEQRSEYESDEVSARSLVNVGDSPMPEDVPLSSLAAWTTVCSVVMSMDEVITRN